MASGYIDIPIAGVPTWKASVATSASLPGSGNTAGDARVARDSGVIYAWNGSGWQSPSGSGTVTSVGVVTDTTTASIFANTTNAITGSPVTGSGNMTLTLSTQAKNTFLAGPTSGSNAAPAFRVLNAADMLALTGDVTTSAGSLSTSLVATTNATLTTLSGLTTASALVTVGTIGTGVWAGTAVAAAHGGTGISTSSSTGIAQVSSGTWSVAALTVAQMTIATVAIGTVTTTATVTWSSGNVFTMLLTNSDTCVVTFSGAVSGQTIIVKVAQPTPTGSGVITWPTAYWAGGTVPTMSTGANVIDVYTFVYDGTNYYGSALQAMAT